MRRIFLISAIIIGVSAFNNDLVNDDDLYDACRDVECRAGRECVSKSYGPQCVCITECPDHFRPICGTDGNTYDNHCLLHQAACIMNTPISIEHKGYCKKSYHKYKNNPYLKKNKNKIKKNNYFEQNNEVLDIEPTTTTQKHPAACYSSERDTLRDLIIQNWENTLKAQPWHVEGMTYRESLWGRFFTCDTDKNNYLAPDELLVCSDDTLLIARPGQDEALTKALCIDALVNDGDSNQDWRLDFEEFTKVMNPLYHPEPKECSLEGKKYKDGKEVTADCNHCVCAAGNWVCTSNDCSQDQKKKDDIKYKQDKYQLKKNLYKLENNYKKTPKTQKAKKNSRIEHFDYYDESEEFSDLAFDEDSAETSKKQDKKEPKVWEEFLMNRAEKRHKEGKRSDIWDLLVETDELYKDLDNELIEDPTEILREFLKDNLL